METDIQKSIKYNRPEDVRSWFYFPIVMPLNADGHGPASDDEIAKLTWEVWSQDLMSHASFDYLPDAINKAYELTNQMGWNLTFEKMIEKGI